MKRIVLFLMFFVISSYVCFAAEHFEVYHYMEGSELTDYTNIKYVDKVSTDIIDVSDEAAIRTDSGSKKLPEKIQMSAGAEFSVMSNVKTYTLPISFGLPVNLSSNMREFFHFNLKVPYTRREIGGSTERGLGDVKLAASYLAQSEKFLFDVSSLVKFDTGDTDDVDVMLGTGSTDFALSSNFEFYLDKLTLKLGFGYVFTGDHSDIDYGNEYLFSGGAEYSIKPDMIVKGLFIYNIHDEDEVSGGGEIAGIDTLDFIPCFSYDFGFGLGVKVEAVIPVLTEWNGESYGSDDPDRDPEFRLKFNYPFF